jgi:hypothetical protein
MANYRHVISLARTSNIDEDRMQFTIHTRDALQAPTGGSAGQGAAPIVTFAQSVAPYWNENVISEAANAHLVKSYGLQIGQPGELDDITGSPLAVTSFTTASIATGIGGALPAETACVISLGASPEQVQEQIGPIRPRARRRGRIYIPFLHNDGANVEFVGGEMRVTSAARNFLLGRVVTLASQLNAAGHELVVYSRKDGVVRPVTTASVDNALDTVRSRGSRATAKSVGAVTQP